MKTLVVLLVCVLSTSSEAKESLRCAFDIGSSTTKVKLARVNPDTQTVIEVLYSSEAKVNYGESLTPLKLMKDEVVAQGIITINTLKQAAAAAAGTKNITCSGVATAGFRAAANRNRVAEKIAKKTGVDIKIIDQDEEGRLGFYSGVAAAGDIRKKSVDAKAALVWDIGGGSQQVSFLKDGKIDVLKGDLASKAMKNYVIQTIQKKKSEAKTPNPISAKESELALAHARAKALELPAAGKEKIKEATDVIGISGVLAKSVRHQTKLEKGSQLTQETLQKTLQSQLNKSDGEIGGDYADTDVTNLILVLGYMQGLGIQKVTLVDANLTDGMLIHPDYWKKLP